MKDILITTKRQLTELKVWLGCFLFAYILNICSIIIYNTEFKELYTQIHWVFILSVVIYGVLFFFRILFYLLKKVIKR